MNQESRDAYNFNKTKENPWLRWYNKNYMGMDQPWEKIFKKTFKYIPENIDTVIDLGCAAGRNLYFYTHQPQIKNLIGIDVVTQEDIDFYPLNNFKYYKSLISEWIPDISLENSLIISHGSFMYYDYIWQNRIIDFLMNNGCKNFILQEYDKEKLLIDYGIDMIEKRKGSNEFDVYPFDEQREDFIKKMYHPNDIIPTWIKLEGIDESKIK